MAFMLSEGGAGSVARAAVDGAGEQITVDGLKTACCYRPSTAQAVADLLGEASAAGQVMAPVGGGTALALGNIPERLDFALSTLSLDGIIDYEPSDLVLSVGAGARFRDVQNVLASHGQTLPLDPPDADRATIGGLIATARSGPRRCSAGTLRDYLVGMAVAHSSGTVTKSGGMVVKNVTGFDLPRVYHGSLGTLGVVVSANFKVLPLPQAEATLVARADGIDGALAAAEQWEASLTQPAVLEVEKDRDGWMALVRMMGRRQTVRARARDQLNAVNCPVDEFIDEVSAAWWERHGTRRSWIVERSDVVVRCAVRPKGTGGLCRALVAILEEEGNDVAALHGSIGAGIVQVRLTMPHGSATSLLELQHRLLTVADHVTVVAAPPSWKSLIDVWGQEPDALDVMRSLKEQFDPQRVLNRGRFIGRI